MSGFANTYTELFLKYKLNPSEGFSFTSAEREVVRRLAEIEAEDASICAGCGGEDCICCEIYHDRQAWVLPSELFEEV